MAVHIIRSVIRGLHCPAVTGKSLTPIFLCRIGLDGLIIAQREGFVKGVGGFLQRRFGVWSNQICLCGRSGGRGAGVLPPLPRIWLCQILPLAPHPFRDAFSSCEGCRRAILGVGCGALAPPMNFFVIRIRGSFADIGAPSVLCESNLIGTASRADLYQQNRNGSARTEGCWEK